MSLISCVCVCVHPLPTNGHNTRFHAQIADKLATKYRISNPFTHKIHTHRNLCSDIGTYVLIKRSLVVYAVVNARLNSFLLYLILSK